MGGRGGCHLTKLARWSAGYGPIEAINFCEAANISCVVGFNTKETPQDLHDLVLYLFGDPSKSSWAALRAADGHPGPYPPDLSIEIGNEACMSSFVGTFAPKMIAMEAAARVSNIEGKLRYVTGSYLGITAADAKCIGSPNTTYMLLQQVKDAGLCSQLHIDTHITPSLRGNAATQELAAKLQQMADKVGCTGAKLVVLEQNKCSSHFDRALDNGGAAAVMQTIPSLAGTATSQCWTAAAHADGCGEGHINLSPDRQWASPPFYASQMTYRSYVPRAVDYSVIVPLSLNLATNLTIFSARSRDGNVLVVRVLNSNNVSVPVRVHVHGVGPALPPHAEVQTLVSPLFGTPAYAQLHGGWNSPQHPTFISTQFSVLANTSAPTAVPAMSFVVLKFSHSPPS